MYFFIFSRQQIMLYNLKHNPCISEVPLWFVFSDPLLTKEVVVVKDMEEQEKAYLEQNIHMALQQQELDLEDAKAVSTIDIG